MFEQESDLKEAGLRWKLDSDRSIIATARVRRLKGDHLYFHGPNKLGIYYERETRISAGYARRYWERTVQGKVLPASQIGDFDGIVLFRATEKGDVPKQFWRAKATGRPFQPRARPGEVGQESTFRGSEAARVDGGLPRPNLGEELPF